LNFAAGGSKQPELSEAKAGDGDCPSAEVGGDGAMNDDERTDALGLFNTGRSYWRCAEQLNANPPKVTHPHAPVTFLFCHAIELYLKAYLRGAGKSVAELKKISHRIAALADAAGVQGLAIEPEHREVLSDLDDFDVAIEARYIVTGFKSLPTNDALSSAAQHLDQIVCAALAKKGLSVRTEFFERPEPEAAFLPAVSMPVELTIGHGQGYETVGEAGVNRRRTVKVKIKNNTNNEISDGQLNILNLDPPDENRTEFLLRGAIAIAARKSKFVEVACYDEGTSTGARTGAAMLLCLPPLLGWAPNRLPGQLPIKPHIFQLRFSSAESGVHDDIYCRLFLDYRRILRLENWSDAEASQATGATTPDEPMVYIDASAAFFDILENSDWSREQKPIERPISDWLSRRLDDEIHNRLYQNRLRAWGRRCLNQRDEAPEGIIPASEWEKIEIHFTDRPRTCAVWRAKQNGVKVTAYGGVKFSKEEIYDAFPPTDEEISLYKAATITYERIRNSNVAVSMEAFAYTPDDILLSVCKTLTEYRGGQEPLVKLFGNKPPSRTKELVYTAALNRYEFVIEEDKLIFREEHGHFYYENLTVKARRLDEAIQKLMERHA
jgi:hypothetical protein